MAETVFNAGPTDATTSTHRDADYRDPDESADWACIAKYSPYQNI